ncbi:helix-turn-helix transcriptional regulator [Roseisalinus antarcticus]|uniref:helix-turn-helix transcriptional regulator n=1 Tax=Roseisalinus antarcticus TaxID=254357 RepID=UPI0013564C27|nr:helix-turn-helix domain-containing protein [Roseisalinus antarcticus]
MTDLSTIESKLDQILDISLRANPPQLMTTQECAAYLQVSAERLYQMRKEGIGPKFRQPTERWVRYRREDVDAWVTGN